MPHRVLFTLSAKQDIREERDWYDRTSLELGTVLNDVLATTDRIANNPLHFAEVYRGIRQMRVKRFPYVVSYRSQNEQVETRHFARPSRPAGLEETLTWSKAMLTVAWGNALGVRDT